MARRPIRPAASHRPCGAEKQDDASAQASNRVGRAARGEQRICDSQCNQRQAGETVRRIVENCRDWEEVQAYDQDHEWVRPSSKTRVEQH